MAELNIRALGKFEVFVDGILVDEPRWVRRKAKTLVKLLALAPRRTLHREQLAELLWPEGDASQTPNNLHKVIHSARRALEPSLRQGGFSRFIISVDQQLMLAPEPVVQIDLVEFERIATDALANGGIPDLETAAALYTGDLLEEDIYEDWASVPRERTRQLLERTLERLGSVYETLGDIRGIQTFQGLLELAPANEEAHRGLMRLFSEHGQRHRALSQYRLCCDALKKELDAIPEPATVALYESLAAGNVSDDATHAAPPLFHEPVAQDVPPVAVVPARRTTPWWLMPPALAVVAFVAWYFLPQRSQVPLPVPSLAIIPIRSDGGGEQLELLADGMTEGLITSASRLPGIRVMARGTVFVFKGRDDTLAVARELKVSAVLTGRLTQGPETYSLAAELVDSRDGARLWSRQFNVGASDLSSLQQTMAAELSLAVDAKLTGRHAAAPVRKSTSDAEAYRLYVTGLHFFNTRATENVRKSISLFKQALARDPAYAQAWAALANAHGILGFEEDLPGEQFSRARSAAAKATELDPGSAEAYTSLAMIAALYDWNWPRAEANFRRAIDLSPGYATAHHWHAVHLSAMGRFAEAGEEFSQALSLDPLSPIITLNSGYPSYYQHRYRAAREIYSKAIELDRHFSLAFDDRSLAFEKDGDLPSATQDSLQFLRLSGQTPLADRLSALFVPGELQKTEGHQKFLEELLADVELRSAKIRSSPVLPAALAARLGQRDKSMVWLARALSEHSPPLVYIAVDPVWDPLRSDPRFKSLLRSVGLPVH